MLLKHLQTAFFVERDVQYMAFQTPNNFHAQKTTIEVCSKKAEPISCTQPFEARNKLKKHSNIFMLVDNNGLFSYNGYQPAAEVAVQQCSTPYSEPSNFKQGLEKEIRSTYVYIWLALKKRKTAAHDIIQNK